MRISVDILSDRFPPDSVHPADAVETILSETATAFSHQLDLQYDRIGNASEEKYGVRLTQNAVDRMQSVRKAIALCADPNTLELLMDADGAFLETVRIDTFGSLGEEKRGWNSVEIIRTLEPEPISAALNQVNQIQPQGPCTSIAPRNKADIWNNALQKLGDAHVRQSGAEDAIAYMIRNPGDFGTMLLPPYAGKIFASAACALHVPGFSRHISYGRSYVFMPDIVTDPENRLKSVISVILSVADFLDTVCGLSKEAYCIRTGLLAAIPVQGDIYYPDDAHITCEQAIDMIIQQVRFAGQLLNRSSL